MRVNRVFPGILLIDYVLVLLFCTLLSLATGLLNEGNLEAQDASAISAVTMQDTDTLASTPAPTLTATPTPTVVPTGTPTVKNTPTVEPTKAPYVFPRPIYTREKPMPTGLR
jgi:hypothetical protein